MVAGRAERAAVAGAAGAGAARVEVAVARSAAAGMVELVHSVVRAGRLAGEASTAAHTYYTRTGIFRQCSPRRSLWSSVGLIRLSSQCEGPRVQKAGTRRVSMG